MQLQVAVTGTPAVQVAGAAASATADKFALSGVTPTDFQMNRGDCWLFATVGLLEDSYRRYGVAHGWLKPNEYLHLSRQAFGVAVLDACRKHNSACAFDGDAIYTGNSTTGGEVELIYYLPEVGGAPPALACHAPTAAPCSPHPRRPTCAPGCGARAGGHAGAASLRLPVRAHACRRPAVRRPGRGGQGQPAPLPRALVTARPGSLLPLRLATRRLARASQPLIFAAAPCQVRSLRTMYNRNDVKAALVRGERGARGLGRQPLSPCSAAALPPPAPHRALRPRVGTALGLSTAMIVVPYLLPCTAETAPHYRCDPAGQTAPCAPCPLERAYAGVGCCVAVNRSQASDLALPRPISTHLARFRPISLIHTARSRPISPELRRRPTAAQYNLKAEWFHRRGEPILKEGGHSVALVGWNDHYRTESGRADPGLELQRAHRAAPRLQRLTRAASPLAAQSGGRLDHPQLLGGAISRRSAPISR